MLKSSWILVTVAVVLLDRKPGLVAREICRGWHLLQNTFKIKNHTSTMGKGQLTDIDMAKLIGGRYQGLTIRELSAIFK